MLCNTAVAIITVSEVDTLSRNSCKQGNLRFQTPNIRSTTLRVFMCARLYLRKLMHALIRIH